MPSYDPGDGHRLYYEDAGPRTDARAPLVLLHGWACHAGYFTPQREELADRFRLIAPDLRGHRHSHEPGDAPDIAQLARDLRALIDQLALPAPVLAGWSMGALVAFEFIRRYGASGLAGLVVVDMTPRIVNDSGWPHGLLGDYGPAQAEKAPDLMRQDWPLWVASFLSSVFAAGRVPDQTLLDWVGREMGAADPTSMAALWRAMTAADYRSTVPRITLPTLIVRGALSQLYGSGTAEWLARAMPAAKIAIVADAGHAPHLEQPATFNRLIAAFLERIA
ncbi:MAG: alpha/beta fold hydrolase [Candidatus Eiseniibacteriota bacterium]